MTWGDVGRALVSPRGVLVAAAALAVCGAVAGLAIVLGAATHPAVGWLVVVAAVSAPSAWAVRRAVEEHLRREAADARARAQGEELPADLRAQTTGRTGTGRIVRPEPYAGEQDSDDEGPAGSAGGAPPRTWGPGR